MSKKSDYVYFAAFNYSLSAFLSICAFRSFFEGDIDAGYGLVTTAAVPAIGGAYCLRGLSD